MPAHSPNRRPFILAHPCLWLRRRWRQWALIPTLPAPSAPYRRVTTRRPPPRNIQPGLERDSSPRRAAAGPSTTRAQRPRCVCQLHRLEQHAARLACLRRRRLLRPAVGPHGLERVHRRRHCRWRHLCLKRREFVFRYRSHLHRRRGCHDRGPGPRTGPLSGLGM